jgi:hypothetical protein
MELDSKKYEQVFDVAAPRSNEELLHLVTNMRQKKRRPTITAVPVTVMALVTAVTVALIMYSPNGGFGVGSGSPTQTELPGGYDPIPCNLYQFSPGEMPQVGRFMHHSGDKNQYVEFFSDGTVQLVGFDYVEYYRSIFPTDHGYDDEYVAYCFAIAAEDNERYTRRSPYTMQTDSVIVNVLSERESGSGGYIIFFFDKNTIAVFNGSNTYKFTG